MYSFDSFEYKQYVKSCKYYDIGAQICPLNWLKSVAALTVDRCHVDALVSVFSIDSIKLLSNLVYNLIVRVLVTLVIVKHELSRTVLAC